jgi:hypothetical protein
MKIYLYIYNFKIIVITKNYIAYTTVIENAYSHIAFDYNQRRYVSKIILNYHFA